MTSLKTWALSLGFLTVLMQLHLQSAVGFGRSPTTNASSDPSIQASPPYTFSYGCGVTLTSSKGTNITGFALGQLQSQAPTTSLNSAGSNFVYMQPYITVDTFSSGYFDMRFRCQLVAAFAAYDIDAVGGAAGVGSTAGGSAHAPQGSGANATVIIGGPSTTVEASPRYIFTYGCNVNLTNSNGANIPGVCYGQLRSQTPATTQNTAGSNELYMQPRVYLATFSDNGYFGMTFRCALFSAIQAPTLPPASSVVLGPTPTPSGV